MIGLPQDSLESCLYSAKETVLMEPSIARLYPTVVLNDTELLRMYERGEYEPLSTDEAVAITKEMYKIIASAGIKIIRVGLKSTDLINDSDSDQNQTVGHTYHPAFRQLVEGEIAREDLEAQLLPYISKNAASAAFYSNGVSFSNMIGNSRRNKEFFAGKYPDIRISFKVDDSLEDMVFEVREK